MEGEVGGEVPFISADPDSPPVGSPEIDGARFDEVCQPSVGQQHRHHQHHQHHQHQSSQTVTLTDDLRHKIIKQVEYYFSDENLQTDKFLMNYMTMEKEGFVPISVIASFKKMKKLTPDRSLIVAALKESSLLVLSKSKKKVKRLHPLPLNEVKDPQLCTVLVENLPEDHSPENIRRIFSEAGNIKNICIRDPNVTTELKNRTVAEKLRSGKLHALVEYETVESAEKAVFTLNNEQDWRYGMRVKLLKQRGKNAHKRTAWIVPGSENNSSVQVSHPAGEKENHAEHHNDTNDEEDGEHPAKERDGHRGRNRGRTRNQKGRGSNGQGHGTVNLNHVGETSKPPPGPRMPDGTRGFTLGRGHPLAAPQN